MTKNKETSLQLFALTITSRYFALFNNPINRGENFNWEDFPEWVKKEIGFIATDKEDVEFACEYGYKKAKELINLSGFLNKG